jgi:hypothetical protein
MASLTQQMEQLQKQQAILAQQIIEDEERKRKDGYTLERLEALNKGGDKRRNQLAKKKRSVEGTSELIMISHTNTRFDIILEIFKKQDARIQELEEIIRNK